MLSLAKPHQYYQVRTLLLSFGFSGLISRKIFLSQGLGMGLGFALIFVPSIAVQSRYYKRRRALATGIILSGNSVGGVIFPISKSQFTTPSVCLESMLMYSQQC
jgi:MFS family permease